jgi:Arc/MetJ-type ribon-helix-helix transcriptional regulator
MWKNDNGCVWCDMSPKKRVTVSISKEIIDWIDDQVSNRTYKDRSHAFEKMIWDKKQEEQQK